mgnify:CR=1 FL=1
MKLIIVSGRSGSDKSTALHVLEDLGYYCIDNLPIGLLFPLTREATNKASPGRLSKMAVSIDARNLSAELAKKIGDKLASPPDRLAGKAVKQLITTDGVKMILDDGSWALFRKSGTEPVVRVYTEAGSSEELEALTSAAVGFVEK